jgi:pSer/pThr/pTyr-binding forkhead associated (FHA) protein
MLFDGDIRDSRSGPSKNGIYINDLRILRTAVIIPESKVRIGNTILILKRLKKATDPNGTV